MMQLEFLRQAAWRFDLRQCVGLVPSLGNYPLHPIMPPHRLPTPAGPPISSGPYGAFTPKNPPSSSLHPSQQLLISLQNQDKPQAQPPAPPPPPLQPGEHKVGKWCQAHVQIAWKIHMHQQKQIESQRTPEPKPPTVPTTMADPLRPPSHLMPPGSSLVRPPTDLASLFARSPHVRSPFDSIPPGHPAAAFLNASPFGLPPFQRPSPYTGLGSLGSGAFGGLGSICTNPYGRSDLPPVSLASPHEWNRLHRTPPTFPTPPSWPKSDVERERERERERDRERERRDKEHEGDRDRHDKERRDELRIREEEKEKERMRELSERERERDRDLREKSREHERLHEHVTTKHSPGRDAEHQHHIDDRGRSVERTTRKLNERPRSRSPLRNGPDSSSKHEYHNNIDEKTEVTVKQENKDPVLIVDDRDKHSSLRPHNDILTKAENKNDVIGHTFPGLGFNRPVSPLERGRLLAAGYPGMGPAIGIERAMHHPPPAGLMPSFDLTPHQQEIKRTMEADERLRRLAEHGRYPEHDLLDRGKLPPPLRPLDYMPGMPQTSMYIPRNPSPLLNSHGTSKSSSPSSTVGAPPPLIPSTTTRPISPTAPKAKVPSPIQQNTSPDSTSKDKREPSANGHESETQSR